AGVVVSINHRPVSVMAFTVAEGRVVAIDALVDPERLGELDLSTFLQD
ncbi:MAG: polymerase sigma-70 factor, subfamily, partial [Chloroflexi bacterium]|nr:polymerase sigma-70 factor, subfamily [Chloroflexota bacterium]